MNCQTFGQCPEQMEAANNCKLYGCYMNRPYTREELRLIEAVNRHAEKALSGKGPRVSTAKAKQSSKKRAESTPKPSPALPEKP